jgi:glycosyltransferase involved in cell wall biosynthesis
MNIAVIFDKEIQSGGGFQYGLSIILLLNRNKGEAYNFIFFTTKKKNVAVLKKYDVDSRYLHLSPFNMFYSYLRRNLLLHRILNSVCKNVKFDRILEKHNVDLIYFISPSYASLFTENFNYIITVWDLCHRDFIDFPEVRERREFERREYLFKNILPKAIKVVATSELEKSNLVRRYGIDETRVISIPMLPPNHVNISEVEYRKNFVDIKKKYGINGEYIFYPAQFWSHKNHVYILEGLKVLKGKYDEIINAVFSGSDKGNLNFLLNKAKEFGIENQIHYIGFVDSDEIPYLYRQAIAIVIPTYFGATNIPPLEAFKLGCPVLYSDLPGMREQAEGAALFLDLKNPESLATNLLEITGNPDHVADLIANGKKRVECWTEEDTWFRLKQIFDEYAVKLKCWK